MVYTVLRRGSQTFPHRQTLSKHANYIQNLSLVDSDYPPSPAITDVRDTEERKIVLT